MKLPSLSRIALALLICVTSVGIRAHAQTKTDSDTEAIVSGKVTIRGKPAAGIVVGARLSRADASSPTYKAKTNQEGIYHLKLSTGSYVMAPVAPSFVLADLAMGQQGQTVIVTEAEDVDGINFDLVPGGVITGKVTDADGRPLIEQRVSLMPADLREPRQPPSGAGMITDDQGIYRIFGLAAGRYKVSVGDPRFPQSNRNRAFAQTFYPNVIDFAKAGIVEVEEGSEATKIDITISEAQSGYSVTGRVIDDAGHPVPNASIQLARIETEANSTRGFGLAIDSMSDAQGQFKVSNVPSGKYELSLYFPEDSNLSVDASVKFDVADADVSGLEIKAIAGATIAGNVVIESAKDSAPVSPMWVTVYTRSEDNQMMTSGRSVRVKPDGTFFAGGLKPGIAQVSVQPSANRQFMTSRVERDGIVQPNGIPIQKGEHVSGVRLVLTVGGSGTVRGIVKVQNGTLPPNARMMVQVVKASEQTPFSQGAEVDARGHFLIEGIPAGTYELRVIAFAPDWRRRPPTSKQIVTVAEGAPTEVVLTLDLTPTPN